MFKPFIIVYVCSQTRTLSYGDNMLCPDGTLFNKTTQNCTGCGTGYHGPNCFLACRYPNYGRECQEECYCKEKNCNHITGCFYNVTTCGSLLIHSSTKPLRPVQNVELAIMDQSAFYLVVTQIMEESVRKNAIAKKKM
uniref:Uncharacterized protein LOC111105500 n=1 Tax=Crassostrea virginica TaxID=6565 RepID=A0A8B8AWA1_CRAVI|nr:uncharacterized protein LOC111105500 [Crassostrea virginica]